MQSNTSNTRITDAKAPCKDCPDRHTGCHTTCENYQNFLKHHIDYKREVRERKNTEDMIRSACNNPGKRKWKD